MLDLLFTNSHFIWYRCSYINKNISDHNLIEFSIDLKNDKKSHMPIQNPYEYKVCEYDISFENEGWYDFYNVIYEYYLSEIKNLSAKEHVAFFIIC